MIPCHCLKLNLIYKPLCRQNGEWRIIMKFQTTGVCSRSIQFDIADNKVTNVRFEGGCSGNTQGIAALIEGMDIDEAISRMDGIKCGFKSTSCPDQLAKALKQYKAAH